MATTVTIYRLCVDGDMENAQCCFGSCTKYSPLEVHIQNDRSYIIII